MNKKINKIVLLALAISGLSYAATYSLPYVKYVLYDAMIEASGATNMQLGLMMTIYGLGNVISNLIGGFVTDKLDYRKCIVYSLFGTTVLSAWLALNPTVTNMFIIWGLLVLTTLFLYNPPLFKLTRMVVPDELVGESVGVFAFFQAIGYITINFLALYVYDTSIIASGAAKAFSNVVWTYTFCTLVSAIAAAIIFRKIEDVKESDADDNKFTLPQLVLVVKEPGLWLMVITAFCVYSTSLTASYFTPYFSQVFGVAITFSGALGIINQYGGRLLAPVLGKIATKTSYVSRMVTIGIAMVGALVIAVLILPKTTPLFVLIAVTLLVGIISTVFMNICLAMTPETNVPRNASGAALGVYAAIAYSPDMFQHTLFGYWIDKHGDAGYTFMFIYTIVLVAIGAWTSIKLYKAASKNRVLNLQKSVSETI